MQAHSNNTNDQRKQQIKPNTSKHKPNNSNEAQDTKNHSIIQSSVENNERTITGEVKKEPRKEEDQENDHRNRMPKKTKKDE